MKPKFTATDVARYLQQQTKKLEDAMLESLKFVGEQFIVEARNQGDYQDRTGNLRSSIGYMIFKNGVPVFESFPGSNAPAVQKAKALARSVASQKEGRGFLFVGVAGMKYASHVEARGHDVITSSGINAAQSLRKALERLRKKVNSGKFI